MDFTMTPVDQNEINHNARGKWDPAYEALMTYYKQAQGGLFFSPFTKADCQNMANAIRRRVTEAGLRLRWKAATREEKAGYYIWIEAR